MIEDEEMAKLMRIIMHSAEQLIQSYGSGLSVGGIRTRMKRIANELTMAAEEK